MCAQAQRPSGRAGATRPRLDRLFSVSGNFLVKAWLARAVTQIEAGTGHCPDCL